MNASSLLNVLFPGIIIAIVILGIVIMYNKPVLLIHFLLIYCCIMRFLISILHFPSILRFLPDVVSVLLLIQCIIAWPKATQRSVWKLPAVFMVFFALLSVVTFFVSGQSILSYIWGARIHFRLFVFFFSCCIFLNKNDVIRLIKIFFILLLGNVLVASFQFFVLGYSFDNISGLFGIEVGANAELNIFLVQLCIVAVALYIYNKLSVKYLLLILCMTMYLAAICELKILFFEVPLVFILVMIFSDRYRKALKIALVSVVVIALFIPIFLQFYPGWKGLMSWDSLKYYVIEMGYAGDQTVSRINSLPFVYNNMMPGFFSKMIGVGLGNGDASFFYASPLYTQFSNAGYQYFSYAMLFLEGGVIGTILYLMPFFTTAGKSISFKRFDHDNAPFYVTGIVTGLMATVQMFYSHAFRIDIAYNYMFWLAIPFCIYKSSLMTEKRHNDA